MEHKIIAIDLLDGHKRNYNTHPPEQIVKLKASLERFQQVRSIVVAQEPSGRYTILAGHGVVEAARACGVAEMNCDIVPASWDQATREAYLVADNLHGQLAVSNDEMLAELLQEQQDAGFDLASLGTDDETLRQMLEGLGDEYLKGNDGEDEGEEDADELPEDVETRCKLGDIWQLGKHRLVCGNSSDPLIMEKLFQGEKIEAVVTDPPYAFGLASTSAMAAKSGGWHDMMNNASWFVDRYNQWRQLVGNGPLWVFCNWRSLPILMRASFDSSVGIDSVMIWYKDWIGPGGTKGLRPTYELICLSCLGEYSIPDRGVEDFVNVGWSSHKPSGHKAEKPVDLFMHLLNTSQRNVIFDPFGGSGTSLIACEKTDRVARLCEIEPKYADIILSRWEQLTNQQATLLDRVEEATHA